MGQEPPFNEPRNLKLYQPTQFYHNEPTDLADPNTWFVNRYPEAYNSHGSPFLLLHDPLDKFSANVLPISINLDFFAKVMGGRKDLGHHVIYYEAECAWYYKDVDGIYKTTIPEKLATVFRALLMKCASDMPPQVHKLNLVHEWRQDKTAKAVVNRAKSILLADSQFFSPTSPHQRIKGIELQERIAHRLVSELLICEPGKILLLQDAYTAFCALLKQRELGPVKRSDFKAMVVPIIKGELDVSLRNDLVVDGKQGVRGWKNVRLQALPS